MTEESHNKFIRLSLACSYETAPEILTEIARTEKDDEAICCAIARNINTPVDTLKYLVGWRATGDDGDYPYVKVSREVINNPALPISVLEELLDCYINISWFDLLSEFSQLSRLNVKMIEKLIEKFYPVFWLIDHPIVQDHPELLDKIVHFSREKSIHLKVLNNNLASISTIEYLARSPDRAVRNAVIAHPNVSRKALDIVLFMQGKPGTPISILKDIVSDKRSYFVYLLTLYSGTTSEILEDIVHLEYFSSFFEGYKYRIDGKNIIENIVQHPNVSSDLLNRLMKISHEIYPQGDYKRIIISDLIRKQLSTLSKLSGDLSENLSQITENEELRYSWSNLYEPTPENEIPF
jgi:hypothetical protein